MDIVLSIVISAVIFTFGLWGSIKVVGGYPSKNTLMSAAVFGIIFSLFGTFAGSFSLIILVALFLLLMRYYELGVVQSIIVIVLMAVFNLAIGFGLAFLFAAVGLVRA